jgi:hypothetical protein
MDICGELVGLLGLRFWHLCELLCEFVRAASAVMVAYILKNSVSKISVMHNYVRDVFDQCVTRLLSGSDELCNQE